jgi:regulator of RNase E activity RraA
MKKNPSDSIFTELGKLSTCAVSNAIDSFRVRMLNVGFTGPSVICRTDAPAPMVGIALTMRVRSSDPSMKPSFYLANPDWWERVEEATFPRVLVIEDIDAHPGKGSLVGPVHACIIKALGFVGVVTSGAIRATAKFNEIGLHAFSGNISPSHAYSHVVELGTPVEVAGMRFETGQVIHGDRDGVVGIPADLVALVPAAARSLSERERTICRFCGSADFTRARLRDVITPDKSRA